MADPRGYLALHLHAHLPFVRHPEYEDFLEEDWLYEAISETYLPLLRVFDRAADEGIPFRISLTMSPPLVAMLRDDLLMGRYARRLDMLCELAEKEVHRTRNDPTFHGLAQHYRHEFFELRTLFHDRHHRDLVGAFRRLEEAGRLELLTCGATHGFLPLMQRYPEAVRAQVAVAAAHHRRHFGKDPAGIWLPECGYFPGVEKVLAEENIRYFFVDTHGVIDATPRPRHGVYAPLYTPSGPKFYSFNTPIGTPPAEQCGRGVFTDIHVSSGDIRGGTFPANCTTTGFTNQEKALLFLMMDLASCIQDDKVPPAPPVIK